MFSARVPRRVIGYAASFPVWTWVVLASVAGAVFGLGIYTFSYARGLSYLSNDPAACMNCHVMRDVYEAWNHSSHKAVATCNDCHIPHNLGAKYLAKSFNGWHHSSAFTAGGFHEPIRIKKYNRDVLVNNCLHCHGDMTGSVAHADSDEPIDCLKCHSEVGHAR